MQAVDNALLWLEQCSPGTHQWELYEELKKAYERNLPKSQKV